MNQCAARSIASGNEKLVWEDASLLALSQHGRLFNLLCCQFLLLFCQPGFPKIPHPLPCPLQAQRLVQRLVLWVPRSQQQVE